MAVLEVFDVALELGRCGVMAGTLDLDLLNPVEDKVYAPTDVRQVVHARPPYREDGLLRAVVGAAFAEASGGRARSYHEVVGHGAIRTGVDVAHGRGYRHELCDAPLVGFDRAGGTGKTFDWNVLKQVKSSSEVPIILSGGLNTQNVIEPVNELKPYAVDVNSGVEESLGKKDHKKMKDFIDIVNYISGAKVKEHI